MLNNAVVSFEQLGPDILAEKQLQMMKISLSSYNSLPSILVLARSHCLYFMEKYGKIP